MSVPKIFVDVETTGLDSYNCAIREIAIIVEIDGMVQEEMLYKMRPHDGAKIEYEGLKELGVDVDALKFLPSPAIACLEIVQRLERYNTAFYFVGHNALFDKSFFRFFLGRFGKEAFFCNRIRPETLCTLEMSKSVLTRKKHNLQSLCEYFKIKLENAHNALDDIKATYELYYKLDAMKGGISDFIDDSNYDYLKKKYWNSKYITIDAKDVWIREDALKDKTALRFIISELEQRLLY